jgi:secreted PhoX family phosphatase
VSTKIPILEVYLFQKIKNTSPNGSLEHHLEGEYFLIRNNVNNQQKNVIFAIKPMGNKKDPEKKWWSNKGRGIFEVSDKYNRL